MVKNLTSKSLSAKTSGLQESYNIGLQTGIVTRNTDGDLLASVSYHDLRGLVVESMQIKPDEVFLRQSIKYSFTRKPIEVKAELTKGDMTKNVTQLYVYNPNNDKIETMTIQVGNVTRTVASYSYDDIGRLVSVNRSGNAGSVHYAYNIRNWLKETKSDRFKQNLYYESTKENPCFNGNISRMQWQSSKDNVLRGYDFTYDGLNRLEESAYGEGADLSQSKSHYSEHVLSYSPNGSIERLQRYGKKNNGTFGLIDDLTYAYNGNQIKSISDKAGSLLYDGSFDFKDGANADVEYFYDANGALVKDLNKGISNIEYDVLGNLKCITFNNGFKTKYVYDAAGNKLRTTHESVVTNTTDYIGNFIFEDGKLDKYLFDGGYCSFDNNQNPTFHYYEKDHLASVRMVVNENGTIEQVSHYYPFGGVYGDLSYNGEYQKSKYIGKEFDHMHGLDWYDHGARMYDAAKVAWDRVDSQYNEYYPYSPYIYSMNNPINALDTDGRKVYVFARNLIENKYLNVNVIHTFVVVKTSSGKTYRFAYGPQDSGFWTMVSGHSPLVRCDYYDDESAVFSYFEKKQKTDGLKKVMEVNTPTGMTSDEFDKAVINAASEFRDNTEIKYRIIPTNSTEGNCNTSTTTLLKKAGVSDGEINRIKNQIPKFKTGFGDVKPWSDEERKEALRQK